MCLTTNNLMSQEKIVVLKATSNTVNDIINNGIYGLTNLLDNYDQFKKFILVDEMDTSDSKVLAIGNISKPKEVNVNSKSVNIFNNSIWKWEYELSNIIDLRGDSLTLEEILMGKNLDEINYTVQFWFSYFLEIFIIFKTLK